MHIYPQAGGAAQRRVCKRMLCFPWSPGMVNLLAAKLQSSWLEKGQEAWKRLAWPFSGEDASYWNHSWRCRKPIIVAFLHCDTQLQNLRKRLFSGLVIKQIALHGWWSGAWVWHLWWRRLPHTWPLWGGEGCQSSEIQWRLHQGQESVENVWVNMRKRERERVHLQS